MSQRSLTRPKRGLLYALIVILDVPVVGIGYRLVGAPAFRVQHFGSVCARALSLLGVLHDLDPAVP